MSSSASRGGSGERMIHQDFIARIRFSNGLPPPPNPPKLLDIPNTGGQYTTPGFASRLAREQPLNIEADAELGMPLDLVGMPGIFDGDESSIQAPSQKPHVHPHDQALLKPLSTLGKPKVSDAAVSFLRRTEYISSVAAKHRPDASPFRSSTGNALKRPEKRKSPEPDAGTPAYVRRKIEKSFDIAQTNLKDRSRVKHPTKKNLRVVEAFPVLPDLDAFPDSGAYVTVKFTHNPVPSSTTYDRRLLAGLFQPIERSAAEETAYNAALEAHELNPERNPKPSNAMNYDFFLPDTTTAADNFRQKFDYDNPNREDEALYTAKNGEQATAFHFSRVRGYETGEEKELAHDTKYSEEIILSFSDRVDKAVFYYPVMQRTTLRSQRGKNIARTTGFAPVDEGQHVDQLDVTIEDPTEDMLEHIARIKEDPLHFQEDEGEEQAEETAGGRVNGGASDGDSPTPNGRAQRAGSEEEVDAEGDEEE